MPKLKQRVRGGENLARAFGALGKNINKELEGALHAGGSVIEEDAARRAPKRTRNLAEEIKVETLSEEKSRVVVGVGPDDKEAFYSLFVEFGVDAHTINRENVLGLDFLGDIFRASAEHPGASAQPFLRPAFDKKQGQVVDTVKTELRKRAGLK